MLTPRQFPEQEKDEKVLYIFRRHWFVFFKNFLKIIGLTAAPLAVAWFWNLTFHPQLAEDSLGYTLLILGGSLYFLFLWILLYNLWLDYALDFFAVTNKRVVDIEQSGLFHRTVVGQNLNRIQDVTSDVKGVFPTFLGYGNVYIETAGARDRFVFAQVPHPEQIVNLILDLAHRADPSAIGPPPAGVQPAAH